MRRFRLLRADEIELRVGSVMNGAASLLLYKDARCDMNILDETVGEMDWKREHLRDNRNCIVSIWDKEKEQWVSKEDTGTESNTEKEKGLASDSFKRACVNWGIGRELYSAPRIKIKCETKQRQNGYGYELANKWEFYGAYVSQIEYDETGNVVELEIVKGENVIYEFKKNGVPENMGDQITKDEVANAILNQRQDTNDMQIDSVQAKTLMDFANEVGVSEEEICKQYKVASITAMNNEQYGKCMRKLKATKEAKGE